MFNALFLELVYIKNLYISFIFIFLQFLNTLLPILKSELIELVIKEKK